MARILKGMPGTTIASIRASLMEDERNQALTEKPPAATEAHFTAGNPKKRRSNKWCNHCRTATHNTEDCYKKTTHD